MNGSAGGYRDRRLKSAVSLAIQDVNGITGCGDKTELVIVAIGGMHRSFASLRMTSLF